MAGPAFGTNVGQDFSFLTDIDLSTKQFYFVYLDTDGYLEVGTAGRRCTGVVQDDIVGTAAVPKACQVRTAGPSKIVAGGSFVAGDLLASDSAGKAVKYTAASVFTGTPYTVSGSQVLGVALEPGSSGTVTSMLFQPSGLAA